VYNNTSRHLFWVKVTANFFDSGGQLVDVESTLTDLDNLPAGDKTCFDMILLDEPAGWSYYEFETSYLWEGKRLPNLAVLNDRGSYDPTDGS